MSFNFNFTVSNLEEILPKYKNIDSLFDSLAHILPQYDIDTPERVAGFLAQCTHESAGFTVLSENLNYSADGLCKIFGKYFTPQIANQYARNPEKIANKVYANRMDNGDEASGDGWQYRGRGAIQLTGKHNYTKFAENCDKSLEDTVNYLGTLDGAIESAAWFWKINNVNRFCDAKDIVGMTKVINGGTIGIEDRTSHWNKNLVILGS